MAQAFSSEDPDSLRGPQFDGAWCDEVAAWKRDKDTFEMLQLGLRLGRHPRAVITTTPRRTPLIRQLMSEGGVAVTRSATRDNADFLSPAFISHIEARMGGTRLGRQELEGEFLEAEDGVFWTRAMLLAARAGRPPSKLGDIIVAVDRSVLQDVGAIFGPVRRIGDERVGPKNVSRLCRDVDQRLNEGERPRIIAQARQGDHLATDQEGIDAARFSRKARMVQNEVAIAKRAIGADEGFDRSSISKYRSWAVVLFSSGNPA